MSQQQRILLIVDDSPEDRKLYQQYLLRDRKYSYTILEATLGVQALELWQRDQPDAVLLNYRLSDLDGLEFLAQLQLLTPQPCLPVIVVTGQANEAIALQAIKAGAQNYIVKEQITPEGLQIAINGAIETVRLHTQLQQRIERERVVSYIIQKIHQSLNLDEILQTIVTQVREFLHTDRVLVFRFKPDGNGTVVAESVGAEWRSLLSSTIYDPCLAENYLAWNRQEISYDPAFIEDYIQRYSQDVTAIFDIQDSTIDPCDLELLADQVKANLVVPIIYGNYFWGLLIVHKCVSSHRWQPLEIDLVKEVASQVGIAIRQTELYEQVQNGLTERRRVETQLRSSEEQLRLALLASRMGTWNWNIQTGKISWSDNLEALFGLQPGEFDGSLEMFVARLHLDDCDRVLADVAHAVATGEDYDIEFRVVYPNGKIRWTLSQGKVFYNQQGQPMQMAGIDIDITERKRSADAVRESGERFRQLAENIDAVFWITEVSENRVSYVSPAYQRLWGLNPEELYQGKQSWVERIHPEDRESTDRAFHEKAVVGKFDQEYRIILPDGSIRWVHDRCFPLRDETGEIYRFAGIAEDISERKQVEQSLRDSEERLQMALEGSGGGLWDWNIVTNEDYLSSRWLEMLGYEQGELPGNFSSWERLIHPEDKVWVMERLNAHLQDDSVSYKFEYRMLTKSGEWKWIANHGKVVLRDQQGNALRMAGIHHDITDRKQAEEALRQSEERYRCLAELIPQLVWTANAEGALIDVNQRWLEFTGLTPEQTHNICWKEVIHPEDIIILAQKWSEAVQQGTSYQAEGRMRRADGVYRWHLHQAIGQKDKQGQILKWFGSATDIEAQKQLEAERDRLFQLEQTARAEAERANRIKDEFLAILSHELRSPLNPILGWTKLLQTRKFNATKTAEALATIERNAKLQTQLIDDLLDVAKILRGKLSIDAAPVNLAFVIESAIDTVSTAAIAKSILLHPVLPNIGQVSGDSNRLQQIVWNLLSNAIKFTPKGGRVEIRLKQTDDQAQIIVSDTGKGISPDFLPYIFESFRQEDVSITRKYGGLGLGLAIVRQLVEAHGGTIAADSPGVGLGATFTVQLPLLNVQPEINQRDELSQQALELTGIRVLTVDDDPDARELLTVLLAEYGAQVLTVSSAAEVLTNLESFQPDVLISDIGMPEVDGYSLIQQIRTLTPEKGGKIPAIALTAYARVEDYQQAIISGYQRHVIKPLDPEELVQAVVALAHSKPSPS
ncbi:MAG: PAS domain-containing protein [Nostoc sp.]|uniref:PAS domain-containing protein n=1 Tax=Nostoc sp. TaxID=1180 RepID=UPI002FFA4CBF